MSFNRRILNKFLLLLAIILGGTAVWLSSLPPLDYREMNKTEQMNEESTQVVDEKNDSILSQSPSDVLSTQLPVTSDEGNTQSETNLPPRNVSFSQNEELSASGFEDVDPRKLISNHPFRKEALNILNNHLEETDSINRRKILSYCEHLRTSYTTKDLDFIKQVFSDNALIIVGNVVRTGKKSNGGYDSKVAYAVRSKQTYLSKLSEIFNSNKNIRMDFSDFHILRHPSMKGIYGVSLRQKYSTDKYSDDGYLFLLWDFRNQSMPLIHVRTWQPHKIVAEGEELIDFSDFNLE